MELASLILSHTFPRLCGGNFTKVHLVRFMSHISYFLEISIVGWGRQGWQLPSHYYQHSDFILVWTKTFTTQAKLLPMSAKAVQTTTLDHTYGLHVPGMQNDYKYRHFSVLHSEGYKKKCWNRGDVSVDTNYVEGRWSSSKGHFKKTHGTSITNFESHISSIKLV